MNAYIIGTINIDDPAEYKRYIDGFYDIFSKYDGEILVVEEEPEVLEGTWPFTRTVVIRFKDKAEAKRWYESDEYQKHVQHRFRAASSNVILAGGRT